MNLIIHHWDMDGIASAIILTKQKEERFKYFTPTAGNYFLSSEERAIISSMNPDKIYLVDMSLPKDDLIFLNNLADFEVFDHHSGHSIEGVKIHNPILEGAKSIEYPSCTTVLKEYFKLEEDIFYWSGIWGDFGFKLKETDYLLVSLKSFLNKNKIEFKDFKLFVTIADSQYKTGDKEKIYELIDFLLSNPPINILSEKIFSSILSKLEEVKKQELKRFKTFGKVEFLKLKTPYYVISDLCRLKFSETPDKYNIVLGERKDFYNFYMRTGIEDLSELIKQTKSNGFFGGGKKDVLGVVMPKDDFDKFVNFISGVFFKQRGINIIKILKE
jgi:hypothetical protein